MSLRQRQACVTALESNDGADAAGDLWRPATPQEIAAGGFHYENGSPKSTTHTFAYYLAGELTAAREVGLSIPWPSRPQSEP